MKKMEIMEKLGAVIVDGDEEGARRGAKEALANEIDPLEAVEEGLSKGMSVVGDRFEGGGSLSSRASDGGQCLQRGHGDLGSGD
jgi:methanogenic corrinoid protein MtbC1